MVSVGRRLVLQGAGCAVLAATTGFATKDASAQQAVPYSAGTEAPKLKAPAGATDCHMHIYDNRFPIAPTATLRPPDAHVDDYRLLQQRIGTERAVIVTPSTYGTDNRCTLDAMRTIGASARGVAVVDTSVTDAALKEMASAGIRGIRFNLVQAGATTIEMIEPLSKRAHELGWHIQIHMLGDKIVEIADVLQRLPSPVVFDHLGRIPQPQGVDHPAFRVVADLVDKGRAWVKLSGAYIDTKSGPPAYADTTKVAQAYAKLAPERLVWGSDWPHPTEKTKPDDAVLFDLLAEWVPSEAARQRILRDNPATLYDFPKAA
jgi:predicted TIM-barrel fold metal-dependent hydrolase